MKPYPISMHQLDKVKIEIKKMLKLGIISRSKSQYINPCVVVPKKDGSFRLFLDARKINNRIENDHGAPPSIEEILQKCNGIKCMSSLDLTASYWQIELTEDSKKYTAFMVDGKVYEYSVCPFGLKVSGPALLRGLKMILKLLYAFLLQFVDDLMPVSKSVAEHLYHIQKLLKTLAENNVTLNFEKTEFFK